MNINMVKSTLKRVKCMLHSPRSTSSINWHQRAAVHGRRAVLNLGHKEEEFDTVTQFQKAKIFPLFRSVLSGEESLVLDLGCGPGRFSGDLASLVKAPVLAVDPISKFLEMAPPHASVDYQTMKDRKIPATTGTIDVVWICLVLGGLRGHVLKQMLCEVNRVLKRGGLLFLVENTSDRSSPHHYQFRSVASYKALTPFVQLDYLSSYQDLDETISVMAGRKQEIPDEARASRKIRWCYPRVQRLSVAG
jgi:ubiquinone/menaquinone biosynthesis C-methylase UbiE